MLRVILADDEKHIRSLLKYLIHWEELGLELVGEFDNGQDVVDAAGKLPADIIVSDIQMPGMDGLTMIREVRELRPDCRFVIISGFRHFEYAQKAVKLGVSDYILKPIDEDELNAALAGLVKSMKPRQKPDTAWARKKKLIAVVLGQRKPGSVAELNREYGAHFSETGCFMVLWMAICRTERDSSVAEFAERILAHLKGRIEPLCTDLDSFMVTRLRYALLLQVEPENMTAFIRTVDEAYGMLIRRESRPEGERFYLSVGKSVQNVGEIRASTESAKFFINGRLTFGESRVYVADNIRKAAAWQNETRKMPSEAVRRLENAIEQMDEPRIRETVREVFDDWQGEENPTLYIYLCHELCEVLTHKLGNLGVSAAQRRTVSEDADARIENCDRIDMLREAMERVCLEAVRTYLTDRRENPKSYVQVAKSYLDAHYAENITLAVLAEQAHVNAAYLSALFKEEMGVNYSEYLTALRMEHAKTLLTDVSRNVSEVAEAVGYNSTRYFSKLFETQTGIKPGEYRRLYLRHEGR